MKKDEPGVGLRRDKGDDSRGVSALSGDLERDGRRSGEPRGDKQGAMQESERTRLFKEQLLEKLKYVDPVRANSCKSLGEATKAIGHLMARVEYRLMEIKVDGMKNAASTYTTQKAGEMATALQAMKPDLRKDDQDGQVAAETADEPAAARNDSCAQNGVVTRIKPVPMADALDLDRPIQPINSASSKRSKRMSRGGTATMDAVSSFTG